MRALWASLFVAALASGAAARAETLAVMPVKFLDTSVDGPGQTLDPSPGPTADEIADHARRAAAVSAALAADVAGAGPYDATVAVAPEAIAAACPRETAKCLVGVARDAGADHALFVVVQKSSALILQASAQIIDLRMTPSSSPAV